jgi:hypothetical protein
MQFERKSDHIRLAEFIAGKWAGPKALATELTSTMGTLNRVDNDKTHVLTELNSRTLPPENIYRRHPTVQDTSENPCS